MGVEYIQAIPGAEEIKKAIPLPKHLVDIKSERDREIREVFDRASDRFLLVIGPCSAHHEDAVCEYVSRLAKLQEEVKDRLLLVPRIYTNKPRTTGEGYKGMAHRPDPHSEPDIVEGIRAIRKMQIRALSESHLAAADEMLYPGNLPYMEDVLSYHAVGARSVENQQHRLTASGLDVPVGMKSPTGGDLTVMYNAIYAAQQSHAFSYNGWEVRTSGNPLAHAVLRGSMDVSGHSIPDYHYEDLINAAEWYAERGLDNPTIIVDTNHANSNRHYAEQPRIGLEVVQSRRSAQLLTEVVQGLMVESYLVGGSQPEDGETYGQSITDPCLGWEETEPFVKQLADWV